MLDVFRVLCVEVTAITLFVATLMDYCTKSVYRITWWPSLVGFSVAILQTLFCAPRALLTGAFLEVLLFCFLQEFFFCRFYGRADCHGFAVGAAALFLQGGGIWQFLLQMVLAFFLLFLTQLFAHNINRCGNLKRPVAFLPYITVGWGLVQLTHF